MYTETNLERDKFEIHIKSSIKTIYVCELLSRVQIV